MSWCRKKLEFRKMLGRVSDGLGNENLRALKNLCYDIIPSTQREDVDSGVTLFNLLIEKSGFSLTTGLGCSSSLT